MRISDNLETTIKVYFGNKSDQVLYHLGQPSEERSREDVLTILAFMRQLAVTDSAKFFDDVETEITEVITTFELILRRYEAHYSLMTNPATYLSFINVDDDLPRFYYDEIEEDFYCFLEDKYITLYVTPFKHGTNGVLVEVFYEGEQNSKKTILPAELPEVNTESMVAALSFVFNEAIEQATKFALENKPQEPEQIDVAQRLIKIGLGSSETDMVIELMKEVATGFADGVKI